ncbi:hypothetical protein C1645_862491 [Glomus cerebriforme]|uniref:Uncharacterized protein n=1 Tax=Glomus cerebriforme TaxID=658196 RepID=A0A397SAM4_9GLOM|nr:hypothetical protein C1645_862491 [Glomus cerebriforme]
MDIIKKINDKDQQACELINRIRSSVSRPSDYYSLKILLEDYSNPLSNKTLSTVLEVLSDPSIYAPHNEELTIILELHLRTLFATANAFSQSEPCLSRKLCENLFSQLIEFAKFYILDSNSKESFRSNNSESTTINEKILTRNFNNDFLLGILCNAIHDISDNNRTSESVEQITTIPTTKPLVPINITEDENDINSQLKEVFSFKHPISSWYPQWKKLIIIRNKIKFEKHEAAERNLIEQLWSYASIELKKSQNTLYNISQNINDLLRNDPIAHPFWFGVLDIAQEIATITHSITNLIFIYYLALQSLQNAPNIYIRSKAIEVLIITSKKHQILGTQFDFDFQNMLKVLKNINSGNAAKFQKLFHDITQRCLLAQNILHQSNEQMISHQNMIANNQSQSIIYDLLAEELTCPVIQDMSEQFQKLSCGHLLSVQAIKSWLDECRNKQKLFSCCLCRKEYKHEEIYDRQISAMHQGLYQQLISVKNTTIQNKNEYLKNILGAMIPISFTDILVTTNKPQQSKDKVQKIVKKAHPAYLKAKAAIKEEKFPIALFWLNRLLDNWPESYSIRCERAYVLKQLDDFYQSICDLNIAVHIKPKKPRAWCLLGSVYQQMGNNQLALFHVNQAMNLEPTNQQSLLTRGIIYAQMNRVNDALQDFNVLLPLDSQRIIPSHSVSKILQMLHLKKPITNQIANKNIVVECLRERSNLYFKKDKYELTMQVLDQLLQWEPEDRDSLLLRGKTNEFMNNFELAVANFNVALSLYPEDPYLFNRRAICYAEMGKQHEAIKDSNTALKYIPNNGSFYTSRSYIETLFGNLNQALDYAQLALVIDISCYKNIFRRVWTFYHLQRYSEAIDDLNLPADIDDDNTDNAWRFALNGFILHFFESRHDEAFSCFDKAIEFDPELMDAYFYRSQLYSFRGEYEKALKDINHIKEESPNEPYLHHILFNLYYQLGKYDLTLETLNDAERLLSGCPSNFQNKVAKSRILTYRGMTYHKLEKYAEALDNLNRAIEIQVNNHDVIPIVERGLLYYSMGEIDKALIDLEEGLKITPKNDYICRCLRNAHLCRREIYLSRGQKTEATDEIIKAMTIKPILQDRWYSFNALSKEHKDQLRQIWRIGFELLDKARAEFEDEKIIFDQYTFDKILTHWEKATEIDPYEPISSSVVSGLRLMQKNHQDLIKSSQITEIE